MVLLPFWGPRRLCWHGLAEDEIGKFRVKRIRGKGRQETDRNGGIGRFRDGFSLAPAASNGTKAEIVSPKEDPTAPLTAEVLRAVAWDLGRREAPAPRDDYLCFVPVRTGLAYLHWSLREEGIRTLQEREGAAFDGAVQALRVYDVSLIEFDGSNAHSRFDVAVDGLAGHYYLHSDRIGRILLAEAGFRLSDGRWLALARSTPVFMDRNHRAGRSETAGLYVSGRFERVFPVENVYDAPVFRRMHRAWADGGRRTLRVACLDGEADPANAGRLRDYLRRLHAATGRFGVEFTKGDEAEEPDLVHAHNAGSVDAALQLAEAKSAPLVFSLHGTEWERAGLQGREPDREVLAVEGRGVEAAALVVVPHGDTRQQLMAEWGADGDKIAILPDLFESAYPRAFDPGEVKQRHHLHPARPLALFSGEISHAAGADLLVEAIAHVAGHNGEVQFALAGEGPLRGELERQVDHAGFGDRVRFTGDLGHEAFHDLLAAADFVVVPARTWQDEALAHAAQEAGKPVLATHQSRIHCVRHGENGLMCYDNPGSVIWGLQEMFAQPFSTGPGGLMRRPAQGGRSLESVAAELSALYRSLPNNAPDGKEGGDG
jgi:glycosyltransferase involved in cell wall biosynthesis